MTVLPEGHFAAIGSGYMRAYAALYALEQARVEPPERRVEIALQAAAEFTTTVRPPWQIVSVKVDEGSAADESFPCRPGGAKARPALS